jgi:hypothetical protein
MRIHLSVVLVFLLSCSEKTSLPSAADDAAARDAPPGQDVRGDDLAQPPKDAGDDGARDQADGDAPAIGSSDVAAVDGPGGEVGPRCGAILPGLMGDSVDWMAGQCGWMSPADPIAPAAGLSLADVADAMSFRVRVDIDPEAYVHQGYVSAPALAEVGPLSGQGMEVLGPSAGTGPGQYVFDLRWANQVAPKEGLEITLTATFDFACEPTMSRTILATTTAKLVLCRSSSGRLVWRVPGEACDTCEVGSPVDAGTDGPADGQLRWQQVQVVSDLPARMAHVGLVFKDKLWILGGEGSDGKVHNDVWSSSDGSHWSMATSSAGWSPRSLHRGVVFQDKMWIIDGVRQSDVWSSEDGASWTKVVEPAAFPARYAGQVVAFADKMWLIGGYGTSGEPMNDVWSSSDGKTWTLAVESAPWAARDLHSCLVANGKIWLIDGERLGDVWTSSDGSHWEQVSQIAGFPGRMSHSTVFYQGKLWILGGYGRAGSAIDDVWMSTDGASWLQHTIHAPWGPRQLSVAMVFQDKTWIVGGSDGDRRLNDVWTLAPE